MTPNSALKLKHVVWTSAAMLMVVLIFFATRSGAKPTAQAPQPPVVEVAQVEQRDVPVYGEWIGTLTGQVNVDVKAQVTGYLLRQNYNEGSYVRNGDLLFEIDPRPFQAELDQARGQLVQAEAQLAQEESRLATAEANELKSQLDVEKYGPLAKADAVSKQDFDDAVQTNLANKASRESGDWCGESADSGHRRNRHDQPE
jgi:multidrug efflux pump subunit AcrA (membrane-fusion protein)